jgi:hypothetical protein
MEGASQPCSPEKRRLVSCLNEHQYQKVYLAILKFCVFWGHSDAQSRTGEEPADMVALACLKNHQPLSSANVRLCAFAG